MFLVSLRRLYHDGLRLTTSTISHSHPRRAFHGMRPARLTAKDIMFLNLERSATPIHPLRDIVAVKAGRTELCIRS